MSFEPVHPPSPYPTPILDAAIARRQQQDEQQRQVTLSQIWTWLNEFGAIYGIPQAYVFGSVTRPHRFTDYSDVDIAVESIHPELFFQTG
jgi:predicted nucleotidyltransferase